MLKRMLGWKPKYGGSVRYDGIQGRPAPIESQKAAFEALKAKYVKSCVEAD